MPLKSGLGVIQANRKMAQFDRL